MIVRPEQCSIPKCKGCGRHVGHEHERGCLIVLAEAVRLKAKRQEFNRE